MDWSRVAILVLLTSLLVAQQPSGPEMRYRSVPKFFRLPTGLQLGETVAVALNSRGHIFVFNRMPSHPILEFDKAGSFVRSFGEDIFTSPHGLRVDPEGNIWATDRDAHIVLKMAADGHILLVLGRKDFPGIVGSKGEQLFDKPTDVAFGPSGEIFVADGEGNSRIVKFDRNGKFLYAWGRKGKGPGEFNVPHSVVADLQGRVYVADRENNRIQIFDSGGNFLGQWNQLGQPWALTITPGPEQILFMADGDADRVLKLDLNGKVLGIFGQRGKQAGQFYFAHGIAVGPDNELYVAEVLNWRVQKLLPDAPGKENLARRASRSGMQLF